MKVVSIGPAFPMRGGVANFNEFLSRMMVENDWFVLNISYSHPYPRFLFPAKIPVEAGLRPEKLDIYPVLHVLNPRSWIRAIYQIRRVEPELVLVHYWSPWLAPLLGTLLPRIRSRRSKTKIIAIIHRQCLETHLVKKFFVKYFFRAVDAFITLSRTVNNDVQKMVHRKPLRFIYHPVHVVFGNPVSKEDARSFLKLDPKEPVLLFFGIVRPYKGLDLLLQAMAREEVRALELRLIIAGEQSEGEEETKEMVKNLDLENHVIVVDQFVPTPEVKYYFSAADMVIQPYKTASRSGITQIAYQFERPMLVTNVGGVSEIVPHGKVGYVVDVSAEAIAAAIVDFYRNNREKEFSGHLKEGKKRFSWDHMIQGIEELYRSISVPSVHAPFFPGKERG